VKYGAFLFLVIAVWLSADQGDKSTDSKSEGKTVYRAIEVPIDLRQESKIQEEDQNGTHLGGKNEK